MSVKIFYFNCVYNVCSVHQGDTMSTWRGYLECIGGCSVQRGISQFMWGSKFIKAFDLYCKL